MIGPRCTSLFPVDGGSSEVQCDQKAGHTYSHRKFGVQTCVINTRKMRQAFWIEWTEEVEGDQVDSGTQDAGDMDGVSGGVLGLPAAAMVDV